MLSGKKTYIVAVAMLIYSGMGWYLNSIGQGGMDQDAAIQQVLLALGLVGLRKGISSNGN